jgi:putative ABC transport system permease protein
MFDLEKAFATWRRQFKYRRGFTREDADELERHVRDHVAWRVKDGIAAEAAFEEAVREVGDYEEAEEEYGKVYWGKLKRYGRRLNELAWGFSMWKNYLTVALRHLQRNKGYTFINVAGLAVGVSCCLLILLFVLHELSYDRFHENEGRIFQIVSVDGDGERDGYNPQDLGTHARDHFPEVEGNAFLRSTGQEVLLSANGKQFVETQFAQADSGFFDVFGFEVVEGDLGSALNAPGSIVLTESTARRYFGEETAVGKDIVALDAQRGAAIPEQSEMIRYGSGATVGYTASEWGNLTYTVTAVIKDILSTSTLQFDLLANPPSEPGGFSPWGQNFLLLREGASAEELERKFAEQYEGSINLERNTVRLQPLTSLHLQPDWPSAATRTGPVLYLYIFSGVAAALLLIACINYVNLATARSAQRAREVGQRKVVGATRGQVAMQFLGESTLMTLVAFGFATLLTILALPHLNAMLGTGMDLSLLAIPEAVWIILLLVVMVALISGGFPAFILSNVQLTSILKGTPVRGMSGARLRKGLVLFQFTASVVLMLGTVIAYQQMEFIRASRLNANDDEVLVIENRTGSIGGNYDRFKQALLSDRGIVNVALGSPPGQVGIGIGTDLDSTGAFERISVIFADEQYLETVGLELAVGADFERAGVDLANAQPIIINETAASLLGDELLIGSSHEDMLQKPIVGVVKDYHFSSLYDQIEPLVIQYSRANKTAILVRLQSGAIAEGLAHVQNVWKQFVPDRPLQYSFLDEELDEAYRAELRMGSLLGVFAGLTLFVACLGLFGLAAFTAERRTKEIGIRKVLGASVASLVRLLSASWVKLVLVSYVMAVPVAYYAMQRWLEDFAYRIDLGPAVFLLAGGLALAVALLTVSYQAIKAATADPVKSLRYE